MFIAALFTIAKLWKQPRCPTTDEWIKKMWYLYSKHVLEVKLLSRWEEWGKEESRVTLPWVTQRD
jgi:hypothetical protein